MSWINDLDACASAGIINFDAPAYIKGAQPRYIGNPDFIPHSDQLGPIKQQPANDKFEIDNPNENPAWKKYLFGGVVVTAIAAGIYALSKGKIKMPQFKKPEFLNKIKVPDWIKNNKVVDFIKDIPNKIKNLNLIDKLKGLFKQTPKP